MKQLSMVDYIIGKKQKPMRKKRKARKKAVRPKPKVKREPWQIPYEEWKQLKGYEPFWMFRDYSPSQWAGMSKRTRRQIERQHRAEARKNQRIVEEHQRAVIKAHFEGKPVPQSILGRYEGVIRRKKAMRKARIETESKEMLQYEKALKMKKMDFGKWWQTKELTKHPQLRGFEHVMRQSAYRYWKATHGITKGVPKYVIEEVGIMKRRAERRKK